MKQWTFDISYQTRTVVIEGKAWVTGNYDGPSKPEAMVRASLAEAIEERPGTLRVTLVEETT